MEINFQLKNTNILVTGGCGFIGSNICEYLLNCKANVTCLDNLSTGYKHNILDFINHPRFKFIEGDIRDFKVCQNACENQKFVLHHAALGSVPRSLARPIETNEVNISGFLNVLVASKEKNVKRFIYAASSSTYGDSFTLPKVENEIGVPLSPYAITKYVNELYANNFALNYNIETIGLRYFNVFGRNQDPNGSYAAVIPKFILQLINHESPIINGDGSFSRDFTYIDNVIQMNVLAMLTQNKNAINQIYNTAFGERSTLIQLFDLVKKYLMQYDSKINDINVQFGPLRPGDIPHSLASIEKAKKLLKYKPTHNFSNGLKETVKWYFNNL